MGMSADDPKTPITGTVRLRADGLGVELSGDFDLRSAPVLLDLLPRMLRNCRERGATRVEIDCVELTLCDSSGLTALIRAHQAAREAEVRVVLIDRPDHLGNLLDLAGLSEMFDQEKR